MEKNTNFPRTFEIFKSLRGKQPNIIKGSKRTGTHHSKVIDRDIMERKFQKDRTERKQDYIKTLATKIINKSNNIIKGPKSERSNIVRDVVNNFNKRVTATHVGESGNKYYEKGYCVSMPLSLTMAKFVHDCLYKFVVL